MSENSNVSKVEQDKEGKPKVSRGRPAISNGDGDTAVVAVNIDGHVITWSDGSWAGDKGLITEAKCKSDAGVMVSLSYLGKVIIANEDNLLGALACMVAINPGRARILSAPEIVNSYLFPVVNKDNKKSIMGEGSL